MSAIKAGDLVVAIKGCPVCGACSGKIFVVLRFVTTEFFQCYDCKLVFVDSSTAAIHGEVAGLPLSWLKKIPPLRDLEEETSEEELRV